MPKNRKPQNSFFGSPDTFKALIQELLTWAFLEIRDVLTDVIIRRYSNDRRKRKKIGAKSKRPIKRVYGKSRKPVLPR